MSVLVDREAIDGDEVARGILRDAARDLAEIAWAVRKQLFAPGERARIAYVGGVFRSEILLGEFRRQMSRDDGNVLAPPRHGPAAGALIEAYRVAGLRPRLSTVPKEK
jgi:N-acetylglucosamine kinase-like BadF-type ATPase